MLRSSPMAILRLLLVCCLPETCIFGVFGSEWLGIMADLSSLFKTVGEPERILGVKQFWLIDTETGAPGVSLQSRTLGMFGGDCMYR